MAKKGNGPLQIPAAHDAQATRELRAMILKNEKLSHELAEAIARVFAKHGYKPKKSQLVALEPVVTRRSRKVKTLVKGSDIQVAADDLSVGIHVIETRSLARAYAITQSAWNG